MTDKLERFATTEERPKLNELIRKEIYHYSEVKHHCESVMDTLTDHYFYVIAFKTDHNQDKPFYFRVDRIKYITEI